MVCDTADLGSSYFGAYGSWAPIIYGLSSHESSKIIDLWESLILPPHGILNPKLELQMKAEILTKGSSDIDRQRESLEIFAV